MRTVQEISHRLEQISRDERLDYPPANVIINPTLALIQLALETEIKTLHWILESPATPQRLPDGPDTADAHQH